MYYLKTEKSLKDIDNNIKEMFFQVFPNMNESEFVWEKEQKDYE